MAAIRLQAVSRSTRFFSWETKCFNRHTSKILSCGNANFSILSATVKRTIRMGRLNVFVSGIGIGAVLSFGYNLYSQDKISDDLAQMKDVVEIPHTLMPAKPEVPISRQIKYPNDNTKLKLTLFQYPTCPFCCKVRAFLDYFGISYDVVEVNPISRKQTKWTTYGKVPVLLVETSEGFQQLNDSTLIISALTSLLNDQKLVLQDILEYYPIIEYKNGKGTKNTDILNKYFLMFQDTMPRGKAYETVKVERYWRQWADDVFVHTLSPNVYRTFPEALQAFEWFSEVGEWDRLFNKLERNIIVYLGASAMWLVGKKLRRRHGLKEDVRESLYDECKKWMKTVNNNGGTFLGGKNPNLADLAIYGMLSSIEGCDAFQDLLKQTNIGDWYYPMKEKITNHEGKPDYIIKSLHNI